MSRPNLYGGNITDVLMQIMSLAGSVMTLGGDLILGASDAAMQVLDPGGAARNIDLPAEADSTNTLFIISNRADGAENITVRLDTGGATVAVLTGSATPGSSETGVFWCDGTTWYSILTSTYDES